jgi:hypothetical protein
VSSEELERWNQRFAAAEAFRYFVLDQGERLLAEQFGGSVPVS